MYIHFDKDEWDWIKDTVMSYAMVTTSDFGKVHMLVHIYDKMIEEEEWERDREERENELTRDSQGE